MSQTIHLISGLNATNCSNPPLPFRRGPARVFQTARAAAWLSLPGRAGAGPGIWRRRGGAAAVADRSRPTSTPGCTSARTASITVFTGKAEVGQNIRTSLTQAVAEELRAPVASIKMVMADTQLTPFDMGTFGSQTTPQMASRLHKIGRRRPRSPAGSGRGSFQGGSRLTASGRRKNFQARRPASRSLSAN